MAYIPVAEIETDLQSLQDDALTYLEDNVEGYEPSSANLDVVLIEATSALVQELAEVQSEIPDTIFSFFGTDVAKVQKLEPLPATAQTTWTVSDTDGHLIRAGWYVAQEDIVFRVSNDVTIPAGQASTGAGEVTLEAVEAGAASNDIVGTLNQEEGIAWVQSIDIVGASAGGEDGEEDDEYRERLSEEFQINSPTPILPNDFVVLAQRIPGIGRATAIDLYDASTSTPNVERCLTLAVTDDQGEPVLPGTKSALDGFLQAQREVNFKVFVVDPTYTTVTVAFTATALPNWDLTEVKGNIIDALNTFISPAEWGNKDFAQYSEDRWINTGKVYYNDVIWKIRDCQGVAHVDSVTLNGGTADVTLSGIAPLVRSGTHTGTVSGP